MDCITFGIDDIGSGGVCGLFASMINGDIDLDGDPNTYEAMSIGLQWTAVPTVSATVEP